MAELLTIPFAAFLAQVLSTRWLFALSASLFIPAGALCGMAWDISSMTAFRVIQGFVGGAIVPTVFATGWAPFSGRQRATIPAILGMVSVLAPTLGRTVGGWLTDAMGWRSIFYINISPGLIVTILAILVMRVDRPDLKMLGKIDYAHLGSPAVFLGCLEYLLEEGSKRERFGDPLIQGVAWISLVTFVLLLARSFKSSGPIVKLAPFRLPTLASACTFNLVIGFGLYSSTYMIPVFLARVRGYGSLPIGTTVLVTGLAQVVSSVIAACAFQTVDQLFLIVVGLSPFATSLWLALNGLGAAELRYASGLFNLIRNLGGSIGVATVNTWLQYNTRIEAWRMSQTLGGAGRRAPEFIAAMTARIAPMSGDLDQAGRLAKSEFGQLVGRVALT